MGQKGTDTSCPARLGTLGFIVLHRSSQDFTHSCALRSEAREKPNNRACSSPAKLFIAVSVCGCSSPSLALPRGLISCHAHCIASKLDSKQSKHQDREAFNPCRSRSGANHNRCSGFQQVKVEKLGGRRPDPTFFTQHIQPFETSPKNSFPPKKQAGVARQVADMWRSCPGYPVYCCFTSINPKPKILFRKCESEYDTHVPTSSSFMNLCSSLPWRWRKIFNHRLSHPAQTSDWMNCATVLTELMTGRAHAASPYGSGATKTSQLNLSMGISTTQLVHPMRPQGPQTIHRRPAASSRKRHVVHRKAPRLTKKRTMQTENRVNAPAAKRNEATRRRDAKGQTKEAALGRTD